MSSIIGEIELKAQECRRKLEQAPLDDRWIPRLKSNIASVVAECIVELLGEDKVEEIRYIDLSGGEVAQGFEGRDVDIIVKVKGIPPGLEKDLKAVLESTLNPLLQERLAWYVTLTGKRDLIEIHIVTDHYLGYGVLLRSSFSPAIRVWPKRREDRLAFVFPF